MARYNLRVNASVSKDLRRVPSRDVRRIVQRIGSLGDDPRPPGCEKLSGQERYRVRVGTYRILYEIIDTDVTVVVVKVGHRIQT
ncbi:MAG: type II toxin-antitoxin system RelE/ParE family toxin [Spirochaeta sp.]|jgi:mRNA interferase RelE/StbE|nr:type II toxin-antitoxin system RelE/ParE family toxin [Spirochaeta sp.]